MEETTSNSVVYMSESEVQNIISSFRSALTMYTNEIEKLQVKNEALQTDLQGELTKSNGLQEELRNLQLKSQEKSTIIEGYQEKISLIEAGLNKISATGAKKSEYFLDELKELNDSNLESEGNKEKLLQIFYSVVDTIKEYENSNSTLKLTTEDLHQDLERMNIGERICKMCMHCKREFIPKQNKEGDCTYHSGKLKYYSCKGCGDDSYFNCCNKCLKCSEGCRRGKHIPL